MDDDVLSPIRVLLADSDPLFRETLARLLVIEGGLRIVATAASGQEALDKARLHCPEVVVLASHVQQIDSFSVLSALHEEQVPTCTTVFLTTDADGVSLEDALSAGARAVLPKGASGYQVAQSVRTVHSGGRYIDQECVADALSRTVQRQTGRS